ncbi:hypothetical protein EYF80_004925 [Liparis tanakae]|uniref:Uncharacterized protein n=1 Tax=Liparis tanakae TaxID=230148 RepID=A0A4Z2J3W2_9TELE|nr:hypothetical protein EYF80_004925 [Liparis tanakae]
MICSEYLHQKLPAYFGWLKVMRHSSARRLTLQAMTRPSESPDRKCLSSTNRHITGFSWALISFGRESTKRKCNASKDLFAIRDEIPFDKLAVEGTRILTLSSDAFSMSQTLTRP